MHLRQSNIETFFDFIHLNKLYTTQLLFLFLWPLFDKSTTTRGTWWCAKSFILPRTVKVFSTWFLALWSWPSSYYQQRIHWCLLFSISRWSTRSLSQAALAKPLERWPWVLFKSSNYVFCKLAECMLTINLFPRLSCWLQLPCLFFSEIAGIRF